MSCIAFLSPLRSCACPSCLHSFPNSFSVMVGTGCRRGPGRLAVSSRIVAMELKIC